MSCIRNFLSPISEIIEDAKNGKMFILIDDEDRENEGDIIVSAQHVTPEQMATIVNYTNGVICLVIEEEQKNKLGLELQPKRGRALDPFYTAFLTSIEANDGVSTGSSAADRVTTIRAAIDKDAHYDSIITPGHIFPILAHKDGLKVRRGHSEASVAVMKLAGLNESAVLCEIVNRDGSMARTPQLIEIAKELNIKISSIELLVKYVNELEVIAVQQVMNKSNVKISEIA
jgi:3,4-dihydroxy-2-butanone 4-phosphate synthase